MFTLRPWPVDRALREWQQEALETYLSANKRDFLMVATPGAGKTVAALSIAHALFRRGSIEQIVINDQIVNALASSIRKGATGLHNVPALLKQIISGDMWRDRVVESTGERATFKNFGAFVEADPPNGLGEQVETLKRLCADDKEALELLTNATIGQQGTRNDLVDNVNYVNSPDGNTSAYALRKLRSDAPEMHARVLAGELSPHAAMVQAGYRKKTIQIPTEAEDAAIVLLKKFTTDELQTIVEIIANHIAVDA